MAARTAISQKNGERFAGNGERFLLGTAVSRTYLIRERVVKRLWNVGNAPTCPEPLYLLGFRQIRERCNLFFENLFFLKNTKKTQGVCSPESFVSILSRISQMPQIVSSTCPIVKQ